MSFHYFILFPTVPRSVLPAAVGARCCVRVICRGGYESAECPSGRNIILNDDIGGARGAAETAGWAFHVRGVTREMKITERRVRERDMYVQRRTYVNHKYHHRCIVAVVVVVAIDVIVVFSTPAIATTTSSKNCTKFRSRISKYDTWHLLVAFAAIEKMSDYKEGNASCYFQS